MAILSTGMPGRSCICANLRVNTQEGRAIMVKLIFKETALQSGQNPLYTVMGPDFQEKDVSAAT
ncbi:MAG: hypothetical protein AB3N13_14460 [Arenibacterium sp.]